MNVRAVLLAGFVACRPGPTRSAIENRGTDCTATALTGTIEDLDAGGAPVAFAKVAATGGDDRRVVDRSGDVPVLDFKDQVTTDASGSFALGALDPSRKHLTVMFYDQIGDRSLEFVGELPTTRCDAVRLGIHSRARDDGQVPLPLQVLQIGRQ